MNHGPFRRKILKANVTKCGFELGGTNSKRVRISVSCMSRQHP